ncbi:hypothetical protein TWF718_005357 [Orbilia javanica]|uniref:BTB domain-containing protein n=1 Tax=Orbilia javanica TaxID=47235 RepID=A0AAN8RE64_9PEZI
MQPMLQHMLDYTRQPRYPNQLRLITFHQYHKSISLPEYTPFAFFLSRLFNVVYTPDVILKVGIGNGQRLCLAHEAIIGKGSEYLRQPRQTEKRENGKKDIELPDTHPPATGTVLNFLYGENDPFTADNNITRLAGYIIFAAYKLGLDKLGVATVDSFSEWKRKALLASNIAVDTQTNIDFTNPPEYWKCIRSICNWAHGLQFRDLESLTQSATPALPVPPEWISELAIEYNPTLTVVLLLEREQRLQNFWSCKNCEPAPMKRTKAPGDNSRRCWGCGLHNMPPVNEEIDFVKIETVTGPCQGLDGNEGGTDDSGDEKT